MLYYGSKKYVEELTDPVGKVVEVVRGVLDQDSGKEDEEGD